MHVRTPSATVWTGPLRDELVMDVADAVAKALLHPRRLASAHARGTRVDVFVLEATADGPDEDILALELRTALPVVATCFDLLKPSRSSRELQVKVGWNAQGQAGAIQLVDVDDEAAAQQCLTRQQAAFSVPSAAAARAVGTLRLRVDPLR